MDQQNAQVAAMRKSLGDVGALSELAQSDQELARKAQFMASKVEGGMNDFEKQDLAKYVMDWHYSGRLPQQQVIPGYNATIRNLSGGKPAAAPRDAMGTAQGGVEPGGFSLLRTLKNVPKSAVQFVDDTVTGLANVFNPDMQKNTLVNLGKVLIGTGTNTVETVAGALGIENPEALLNLPGEEQAAALGQFYADRYGGVDKVLNTLQEDPVGFLGDVSLLFTGVGAAAGGAAKAAQIGAKSAKIGGFVQKATQVGTKAGKIGAALDPALGVMRIGKTGAKALTKAGRFAASQATGLSGDTISAIISNPKFGLAKNHKITRPSLAAKVNSAIEKIGDDLSETGKEYGPIRKAAGKTELPKGWLDEYLTEKGFKVQKNKVVQDLDTPAQLSDRELAEVNKFYAAHRKTNSLTPNQFLNFRAKVAKMSKFDKTVDSRSLENLAQGIYERVNELGRDKLRGLRELDEKFSPMRNELDLLRKEFIDPATGELRDNVMNRIANSTGKGKDQFLARVRKLVPEIEDEVNALKALEDVEFSGNKVGTYTRSVLQSGGIAFGALTGNPLLVIGAIATTPTVAVPILQAYAKVARVPASTVRAITRKLKLGKRLTPAQRAIMSEALRLSTISNDEQPD